MVAGQYSYDEVEYSDTAVLGIKIFSVERGPRRGAEYVGTNGERWRNLQGSLI